MDFRLINFMFAVFAVSLPLNTQAQVCEVESPINLIIPELDFDTALQRTLDYSLNLKRSQYGIDSRAADIKQASLLPNPIFSYSLNQFGGNNCWKGLQGCQAYYTLSQPIELGGKRQLRKTIATYAYYASLVDYEASQLHVLNDLLQAFIQVAANQELLNIAHEETKITQTALEVIQSQVELGELTPIENTKAEINLCNAEIREETASNEWDASKEELATLWGCENLDFDSVYYPFYEIEPPKPLSSYLSELSRNPAYVRAHWNFSGALEILKLEKKRQIPDIEISAGLETQEGPFAEGLTIGISFPLPIFDRNQGGIARASAEVCEARNEIDLIWIELKSRVTILHKELTRAFSEVQKINNRVLKSANLAFQLTDQGYKEGKYEYMDVVDAQHSIFDVKAQYVNAILNYHLKKAELDYLINHSD